MNSSVTNRNHVFRFIGFGIVVLTANLIPYVLTRGAYATDGHEVAGFPFHFHDFGGIAGDATFNALALFANVAIGILVAALGAHLFRDGIMNTIQRWQTWGTPNAR